MSNYINGLHTKELLRMHAVWAQIMGYLVGFNHIVIKHLASRTLVYLEVDSICQFWLTKDGLTIREFHPPYQWLSTRYADIILPPYE